MPVKQCVLSLRSSNNGLICIRQEARKRAESRIQEEYRRRSLQAAYVSAPAICFPTDALIDHLI